MTSQGSYEKHEELKRRLYLNPSILGLEDIISYQEEVLYRNGKKSGQVDIIFRDRYGTHYMVELTTSTTNRARRRVRRQVKRAKEYFKHAIGITVVKKEEELLLEWL